MVGIAAEGQVDMLSGIVGQAGAEKVVEACPRTSRVVGVKVTLSGSEVSLPQKVLISALNVCRRGRPLRMVSVPWAMNVVV